MRVTIAYPGPTSAIHLQERVTKLNRNDVMFLFRCGGGEYNAPALVS